MDRFIDDQDHDDQPGNVPFMNADLMRRLTSLDNMGKLKMSLDSLRQLMGGLDRYIENKVRYINENDAKYSHLDSWVIKREKLLQEVGRILRAMQIGVQTMHGNFKPGNDSPLILEKQVFEQNKNDWLADKSFDFAKSRFNAFYGEVLDESKDLTKDQIAHYKAQLEKSHNNYTDWKTIEQDMKKNDKGFLEDMTFLLSDNDEFRNTDAIWNAMQKFVQTDYDNKATKYYHNRPNRVVGDSNTTASFGYSV